MIGERAKLLIEDIDISLNQIGEALMRAQPPYSGRLTIKFVDEGSERLTPIVQKLQVTRGGKFFPIRVPSTRLSTRAAWKSSFSINYHFVKELLERAEYLINTRKTINLKLRQVKHWESTFCTSHEVKVKTCQREISDIHAAVEDNLRGRTTRAAKEAERERLGIPTIVMDNKHSAKKRHTRIPAKRPSQSTENDESDQEE